MFRTVATILCLAGVSSGASMPAAAAEQVAQPASSDSADMTLLKQQAVQALAAHLQISESQITVSRIEPHTWPDASMGCGKPGTLAAQVITQGHIVLLAAQDKNYRVHVSGRQALVCDRPVIRRKELTRPARARGLETIIEQAREDLAKRLGIPVSQVSVSRTQPRTWPSSALGCPHAGESAVEGSVAGYVLMLQHASRTYTYHTDLQAFRPCPPIELK